MKEILELRVDMDFAHILFKEDEGKDLGSVKLVRVDTSGPIYEEIGKTQKMIKEKYDRYFFKGWDYIREYTEKELLEARFFQIIPQLFTLAGEECGTKYDDSCACPICGSGGKIIPPLKIRRSRIPKTDISITLGRGEEILVSEKFRQVMEDNHMRGLRFEPVYSGRKQIDYFQLLPEQYIDMSKKTVFGCRPFDYSERSEGCYSFPLPDGKGGFYRRFNPPEVYKCPNGDNLGLNILSEAYIKDSPILKDLDYFASTQTIGVKVNLFRPYHLLFCSNRMMQIIKENKLKGFKLEVAHVVDE